MFRPRQRQRYRGIPAIAAAAPWTPLSLPGLQAWYDAADAASITHVSNAVSQWSDKSGLGRHATNTGTFRPTTNTRTMNGRNVIDFDGSDDHLILPSGLYGLSAGANTLLFVFASDATGDTLQRAVVGTNGTGRYAYSIGSANVAGINSTGTTGSAQIVATWNTNTHTGVFRRNGTTQEIWQDGGTSASNTNAANMTMTSMWLGNINTSGNRFNGVLAEVVLCNQALSNADINLFGTYVNTKWAAPWTAI